MESKVFAFLMETPYYKEYGKNMKDHDVHCGRYNGYVGFKANLPKTWQSGEPIEADVLDKMVNVHGGITCDSKLLATTAIIPLTEIPKNYLSYRIIGFDCCHAWDTEENCPISFVKEQTMSLLGQVIEIINNKKL